MWEHFIVFQIISCQRLLGILRTCHILVDWCYWGFIYTSWLKIYWIINVSPQWKIICGTCQVDFSDANLDTATKLCQSGFLHHFKFLLNSMRHRMGSTIGGTIIQQNKLEQQKRPTGEMAFQSLVSRLLLVCEGCVFSHWSLSSWSSGRQGCSWTNFCKFHVLLYCVL